MDPSGAFNILVKLGAEKCRVIIVNDSGHQIILDNPKTLTGFMLEELQKHSRKKSLILDDTQFFKPEVKCLHSNKHKS